IIGAGFFLLQFVISKGRWIGGGDIRLGLLMGFTLGYPVILLAMILAYFIGSIISIGLVASGKKSWDSQVPFGVFLTVSTIATLFFGQEIMSWYLRLF
ncbi:prepilin peptidase, partial [Patescibacteria group bacterium]|nr:prepilin peptidase [Patescibacteria group bacterium]